MFTWGKKLPSGRIRRRVGRRGAAPDRRAGQLPPRDGFRAPFGAFVYADYLASRKRDPPPPRGAQRRGNQNNNTDPAAAIQVAMPSKEDFVEELVSEIKENLRLSGLKATSARHHKSRASPYSVAASRQQQQQGKADATDDAYEMLQELLRDGGLIKEAVRRLQKSQALANYA